MAKWTINRRTDAGPYYLPWRTGSFYSCPFSNVLSTGAAVNNVQRFVPVYVPNIAGVTVTSIGIEITTPGTVWSTRLGIYNCTSQGLPGTLELDAGTISTTATTGPVGYQQIVISKFLRQGWHFLSSVNVATTLPQVRRFASNGILSKMGMDTPIDTIVHATGYIGIGDSIAINNMINNGLPGTAQLISSQVPIATTQDRLMVGI